MEQTLAKNTFQKYSGYKDSGEIWLGSVPSNWELTRLGSYFEERRTKVSDKDYPPLSVTKMGILPQLATAAKSNDGDNRKLVKRGDFVINSRSDRKGSSGIAKEDGSVSLINIVMIPRGIDPMFCNYLLKSTAFVEENYRIGHGIVADLWTTRYDEMKNIKVAIPSPQEQTAIANFLDDKTSKIDQAIAQKEKMIALLKERKQIIIQNAVTKGLDPNVKLKDSGVEWIGEIPEHWEVKRLKKVCKTYGRIGFRGYSTSDLVDEGEGAITISPSNIQGDFMSFDKCTFLSWVKYHESPEIKIFKNDVLIVKTGSTYGKVGYASNLESKATINPQLLVFKDVKIDNEYFYEILNSSQIQIQINREVIGSTIPTISENKILNMKAGFPPDSEIPKIVERVKSVKNKFNEAIKAQKIQIEKLKEYKTTLIDSAVTGKIKVTDYGK